MNITFNPPISDSIQLTTSLSSQTVPLHFTAELTALDHNKLIHDRARIQLWSDIPHNGQSLSDGKWGALDLTYQAEATEEISSHKVSLGSTNPIGANKDKVTLFLEVVVALPMNSIPHFSFTYRIIYPSGDIQWLGAFGQNGSLSFERSDHDLRNFGLDSWTFDKSRMAYVYEVKQSVGSLDVARVSNVSDYCVRAIGPTSFVSDLKEAALLFFVPRSQLSAISLSPTYVFSASPGASLTLSADGHITASGTGTLLFQVDEGQSKPLTFLRQVLSYAKLGRWNLLAWDADSKAIVLATPKDKFPIKAVTIPLWHSKRLIRPIYLEITTLSDMLGTTEFSIFSPDNMRIHLFTVDPQAATKKNQIVSLQSDSTGNDLVMSPIYTLRGYQGATGKSATMWKTVILSPYQIQDFPSDDSGILPTPPPSPHLQPIARLHTLCNTAMSSVPSLPSETCISLQSPINNINEPETLPSPVNLDTDAQDTVAIQKRPNSLTLRSILTMFRSLFYSVFFGIFYRFFWGRRTSDPSSRDSTTDGQPQSRALTGTEDDGLRPSNENAPDESRDEFRVSESLVEISETEILPEGNIEIQTARAQSSQSDAEIHEAVSGYDVLGASRVSDNTKEGRDVYYLQSEPSDSSSKKMTTIALLCTTYNESSVAEDTTATNSNAPNVIDKNDVMERCVQFLDESEPECVVTRCDVDVFCRGRVLEERQVGGDSSYSCSLLQYQLDWGSDLEKAEKMIRISPPNGVDFAT